MARLTVSVPPPPYGQLFVNFFVGVFLAVQDSSIGDLVTH